MQADAFYQPRESPQDLRALAQEYSIEVRTLHNALYDAYLTAQVFQRLLWQAYNLGNRRVEDLLYLAKKGRIG